MDDSAITCDENIATEATITKKLKHFQQILMKKKRTLLIKQKISIFLYFILYFKSMKNHLYYLFNDIIQIISK